MSSNLSFSHAFSKTASSETSTTLANQQTNFYYINIAVPPDILSTVLYYQTNSSGSIQLELLPLKPYLDIIDPKLIDKINLSFLDDAQNSINNLVYHLNTIPSSNDDPILALPAAAIISSTTGDIVVEDLFSIISSGPIDTEVGVDPANDTTQNYIALRSLLTDALNYNMPFQSDGIRKRIIFAENDSLSIRINFTVSKSRKFRVQGTSILSSITIGQQTINLNQSYALNSVSVTYMLTFISLSSSPPGGGPN